MRNIFTILGLLVPIFALMSQATPPRIDSVIVLQDMVEQYGRFEATLALSAQYQNPYNYEEVAVSAVFTGPDGQECKVDGFFMRDYELHTGTGALTAATGNGRFTVRFAPDQAGTWSCPGW